MADNRKIRTEKQPDAGDATWSNPEPEDSFETLGKKLYTTAVKDDGAAHKKNVTVLMLDDEHVFVDIAQHHLQKFQDAQFTLVWKQTIEEATAEVRSNPAIDIILTDYRLRTSNGLDFCLQLNEMGCETPIIFVTATRSFKLAVDAMKLGVEDFLVKEELSESHLPRTILNVLERVRLRKQIRAVEKRMTIAENRSQAIRELVVTLCHEFNNPLAAIKISADLVQRILVSPEALADLRAFDASFQKIESEIKRLRDMNFEKINFHDEQKAAGNHAENTS